MTVSRRDLLLTGAFAGLSLSGCEMVRNAVAENLGERVPDKLCRSWGQDIDPDFHLLSRAGFGGYPGDLERLKKIGRKAWLEEQLNPESIDDKACDLRARRFESLEIDPGTAYEFKREVLRSDMVRHSLLKAVYSRRQLLEVMVEFWTDHFNISLEKGDCIYLKPTDDSKVVRTHALGKFSELLLASARSPAMLVYLDGKDNKRRNLMEKPNENYARELLELHTMGVNGGYTQLDVLNVARALSGFRLHDRHGRGQAYFDKSCHDDGEKLVLGKRIAPGGGEKDLKAVLDIVLAHPSTARYIAYKLTRHFVSDEPPPQLCALVAKKFTDTGGDIKAMLRTIFDAEHFYDPSLRGAKFKRPFRFVVSSLRSLAADTDASKELCQFLSRMGQAPFQYPTPDGYPVEREPWLGSLLWRWNFALTLCLGGIEGANVKNSMARLQAALADGKVESSLLFPYFTGRKPLPEELSAFQEFSQEAHRDELFGLILACPAFQMY